MQNIKLIFFRILFNLLIIKSMQCYQLEISPINYSTDNNNEGYIYENIFLSMQSNLIKQAMDLSSNPCDDFYQYACGNWNIQNPLSSDESNLDIFVQFDKNIINILRNELSNNKYTNEVEAKAKLLYATCIDENRINDRSVQPLLDFIQELGGWPVLSDNWSPNNFNLINLLIKQQKYNQNSLFGTSINLNPFDNTRHAIAITPVNVDKMNLAKEDEYTDFIASILKLLNVPSDKANTTAYQIFEFEEKLQSLVNVGDALELSEYFSMTTIEELTIMNPIYNWMRYFNSILDVDFDPKQLVVLEGYPNLNDYMEFLSNSTDEVIANYVVWRSVYNVIDLLDDRFLNEHLKLQRATSGNEEAEPRWKKCTKLVNDQLQLLSASLYIKATQLDENVKYEITKLTENIRLEFANTLSTLNWIDEETKQEALIKINATQLLIGYPDIVIDNEKLTDYYRDLCLEDQKYFENYLSVQKFIKSKSNEHLDQMVDPLEWYNKPAEANAYFNQLTNKIVVAIGLLQPPIYHRDYPQALKHGSIAFFLAHELTHGFDNSGRLFDHKGSLRTWWTNQSIEEFNIRAECFVKQFDNFTINGNKINGKNVKGEIIADAGGLRHAFLLYKNWLNSASLEEKSKDKLPNFELTDEKLFFIGYGQNWCNNIRDEALEKKILTDEHPPGQLRLIGALQNFEEFSETFNCPIGSPMNPINKCKLW